MGHLFPTAKVSCASVALFGRRSSATFKRTFRICRAACWSYYIILILKGKAELHQRRPPNSLNTPPHMKEAKGNQNPFQSRRRRPHQHNTKAAKVQDCIKNPNSKLFWGNRQRGPRKEPAARRRCKAVESSQWWSQICVSLSHAGAAGVIARI